LIYLLQYLLGLALVSLWVQVFEAPALWAPVFAVAVSMPLTYVLNRWVFRFQGGAAVEAASNSKL
jgi:putative flippase GtrA